MGDISPTEEKELDIFLLQKGRSGRYFSSGGKEWDIFLLQKGRSMAGNWLIGSSLIRSFCSNQMSDCESFAEIAQDK